MVPCCDRKFTRLPVPTLNRSSWNMPWKTAIIPAVLILLISFPNGCLCQRPSSATGRSIPPSTLNTATATVSTTTSSVTPSSTVAPSATDGRGNNRKESAQPIKGPHFPNIPPPKVEADLIDLSFKSAQRRTIDFQSVETLISTSSRSLPRTPVELANVESRLTADAKRESQLAYILEGMLVFISNRSSLRREQIIFGLPQTPTDHTTITRRCPYNVPITCNMTEFRSIQGVCNNMLNPFWGATNTPYSRFLPHNYSDAIRAVRTDSRGGSLPNPRFISSSVHWPLTGNHPHVSQMLVTFAQFLDHDLSQTAAYADSNLQSLNCCSDKLKNHPECLPIEVDPNDSYDDDSVDACINYVRSAIAPKTLCAMGPRDQVNQASHFLDASALYGNNPQDAQRLREGAGGRLWMTDFENGKSLLSEALNSSDCRPAKDADTNCFDAGDRRVNENLPIASLYTLLAREHNSLAEKLAKVNAHWDDEQLYQSARKILIAQLQHITFNEFLPLLLGRNGLARNGIELVAEGYFRGYSAAVNPGITNEFATAASKFWYSLMANGTQFIDRRGRVNFKPFNTQWFQPYDLYFSGVLDGTIRGIADQPARPGDQSVTSALTNSGWLRIADDPAANVGQKLDLAALTIQRGRDHGLSSYNFWRSVCGLKMATSFDDLRDSVSESNIKILSAVYSTVHDIDLFTGGLSEIHEPGALVGPVFSCIIAKQYRNLRVGDRYWYENDLPETRFTPEQLTEIRTTTLARIICENGDNIPSIQPHVMLLPDSLLNAAMPCRSPFSASLDLSLWKEEIPADPEISPDILMNILEKAREEVTVTALADLARAQAQGSQSGRIRTAFNSPTAAVRAMNLESNAFIQGTKHILKRQFVNRTPSNISSVMSKLKRFDGLIKSKLDGPTENITCAERFVPCDHTSKYRSISGWCNNLQHPERGSSERIFGRLLDPAFADGVDEPRNMSVTGVPLPSTREVQLGVVVDVDRPHPRYTHMLMQYGQFVDHDMTLTPIATALNGFNFNCRSCNAQEVTSANCRPIPIPLADSSMTPFISNTTERRCLAFIRSATGRTSFGAREQVNQNTAYVDASMVYGSTLCKTQRLRTFVDGKLNSTKNPNAGLKDLLPTTIDSNDVEFLECLNSVPGNLCFLAGDTRENESPGLTVSHTIWMRLHNQIAIELKRVNSHWKDEQLFQESRRILIAVLQHISFNEYFPRILGEALTQAVDLRSRRSSYYTNYDPNCDATLVNEFSAAAFRFGHTLVQGEFGRYDNNFIAGNRSRVKLMEHFARGDILYEDLGIDQLLIGLIVEPMQNMDSIVTKALTDHLFEDRSRKFSGQDLVAINIMRGRDHGLPGYNEFREYCNLTRAADFNDLTAYIPDEIVEALKKVYKHVDDIDLYIGGISEYSVYGGVVGPTFGCMIAEQLHRTRRCDRFWYETGDPLLRFSEAQLASLRKMTLAKVICDTSDTVSHIQRSVFDLSDPYINPIVACEQISGLNLNLWADVPACNVSGVMLAKGRSQRVTPCSSCTCTSEGLFCQSMLIKNCRSLLLTFPVNDILSDSVCKTQCASVFRETITKDNGNVLAATDLFAAFF
ncbi:uncharacterized protein LOC129580922 [Paramacrobiotus metropolitanus]|uniref:uncharacterized protein LOC129580922 n=1 Tax=Paramacrobiotus metropolitanus TaxID=2943436 RepID=UPI002445B9DB|nr:uncharacterized protein LOC129580922 [Paramacrobiotus metropolitanus]